MWWNNFFQNLFQFSDTTDCHSSYIPNFTMVPPSHQPECVDPLPEAADDFFSNHHSCFHNTIDHSHRSPLANAPCHDPEGFPNAFQTCDGFNDFNNQFYDWNDSFSDNDIDPFDCGCQGPDPFNG